jgi:hypothetical protein
MSREHEVRDAVDRFLARLRTHTDLQLEGLASELLQIIQGDMRTGRSDLDRAAIEIARAVAKGGAHARHDLISRVVTALRCLDDATTLRGVLDALAEGASAEASRVAVLVLDPDQNLLRSYRHSGFAPGAGPVDIPAGASSVLSSAIALRQITSVDSTVDRPDPSLPLFMRAPDGHVGLLFPLIVVKQVAALVYAEGEERPADQPGAPVWSEQVEVLVRHASARLESVTSQRTVEVLTGSS